MSKERLYIFDTTLRDGAQTQGVDFSLEDKEKIASALDNLGVDYIEAGWPGANPTDTEFFQKKHNFKNSKLTSFGMTKRSGRSAENDTGLSALMNSNTSAVCLVGKSWDFHVDVALGITNDENLDNISESAKHFVKAKKEFMFDAEHFFDGYKANPKYALSCIKAAYDQGARWIVLCDTNGGTLPHEVSNIVSEVSKVVPGKNLGIHAHNDTENAVANSLAAVRAGVRQVQGTINGLGERCGNANLVSVIPSILLKTDLDSSIPRENLTLLKKTSLLLDEILNRAPNSQQPYVGENAFSHKGGLHVSAINKDPKTYEHIDPQLVGNTRKIVISDQSGRSNITSLLNTVGINPDDHKDKLDLLLQKVKEREFQGHAFDQALASFEILARETLFGIPEYFELVRFKVIDDRRWNARGDLVTESEATVRIIINKKEYMNVEIGNGPVNALDKALRKSLMEFYPALEDLELTDFKVRILSSEKGTDAIVRVIIESKDKEGNFWTTVGVSTNIIDASYNALRESLIFKLIKTS